ncbi:hypothetical protein D5086_017271 [Populus alba]|uniref:Uncharacterized protein n=1 Tax=Populus alba TaxID=43335 RepID=A0ACC4BXQ1_POPAL
MGDGVVKRSVVKELRVYSVGQRLAYRKKRCGTVGKLWLALIGMLSAAAADLGGKGDFTVRRWVYGDFGGTVMVEEWTQDYGAS